MAGNNEIYSNSKYKTLNYLTNPLYIYLHLNEEFLGMPQNHKKLCKIINHHLFISQNNHLNIQPNYVKWPKNKNNNRLQKHK